MVNFLAHLYLSGDDPEIMIGNFIGDFVKGRNLTEQFGEKIACGIVLHRAIDEFTDHHEIVKRSKARLWTKYGHYSGVIVDIFYDHFLALNWKYYSTEPLEVYAARAYGHLTTHEAILPDRVKEMLPYMMQGNWLVNYARFEGMKRALSGMARRATFDSKMEQAIDDLQLQHEDFQKDFSLFFPELERFSQNFLQERLS